MGILKYQEKYGNSEITNIGKSGIPYEEIGIEIDLHKKELNESWTSGMTKLTSQGKT